MSSTIAINEALSSYQGNIVIGISGKIGSGKDAVFEIISTHFPSFLRVAFADKLKEVVSVLTGCRSHRREEKAVVPRGYTHSVGQLLQIIGESLKESIHADVWCNAVLYNLPQYSVIVDCRCENEAKGIESVGGVIIRVNGDPAHIRRDNKDGRNLSHITETALDNYPFEHVIDNSDTMEELERSVLAVVVPYLLNVHICQTLHQGVSK